MQTSVYQYLYPPLSRPETEAILFQYSKAGQYIVRWSEQFRCYVISLLDDYNRILHIKQIHMIETNNAKYQLVDDDESVTNFKSLENVIEFLVNERKFPLRENITNKLGNFSTPALKPKYDISQANFDIQNPPIAMPLTTSVTQIFMNDQVYRG